MTDTLKICVNCKHYRPEKDGQCWAAGNLKPLAPPFSLVTGLPLAIAPVQEFNISNLEIMRRGAGYCGEDGKWYEVKELSKMIESTQGETQ
jgi:hypothetical protein